MTGGGSAAAPTGAKEDEDAGETGRDEAGVAVSVAEVDADEGEVGTAGAPLVGGVREANIGVAERVAPG